MGGGEQTVSDFKDPNSVQSLVEVKLMGEGNEKRL